MCALGIRTLAQLPLIYLLFLLHVLLRQGLPHFQAGHGTFMYTIVPFLIHPVTLAFASGWQICHEAFVSVKWPRIRSKQM